MMADDEGPGWRRRVERRRARYRASGGWGRETLATLARDWPADQAERIALIDGDARVSFRQLIDEAARLAGHLRRLGLVAGDVVSYQLPNWREAAVVNLAAAMAGLIVNPLVPIYRDAEVGYMLRDCGSRALFIPQRFRQFDFVAMARRIQPSLACLSHVFVVRGDTDHEFARYEDALAGAPLPEEAFASDPDAVKLVLYTSGTTGRAKGVLHTHATLMSALRAFGAFWRVTPSDVVFMASPVSHITGYLYALEQPFVLSTSAALLDVWQADRAADLIRAQGCTIAFGATPFLNELAQSVASPERAIPSLRLFPCGGAPIPPEVAYRAQKAMPSCTVCRIYGATETSGPIAFGERHGDARRAAETDGEIFNAEVKIVAPDGAVVGPGQEGEILARSPQSFVGYLDPKDDAAAFDDDDFFRTGDLGRVDDGYLTTTGRLKDLIIRGGENLSPREIEDILAQHPAVREAAVVGMPEPRLGEAVCGFVTCAPGAVFLQKDAAAFLTSRGLAKQKIPVRLETLDELPKTPSGKVRKDILRTRAAALAAGAEGE